MKKLFACAACAAVLPFTAMAQGMSGADTIQYNYVDARYANLSVSGMSNPDGFALEASGRVADQLFVRGSYLRLSASGVTLDQIVGEVGFLYPIMPGLDLVGTGGVIYVDVDPDGAPSVDDTSFLLSAGVRALLTPMFEAQGRVIYNDNDFYDDEDIDLDIGVRLNFNPQWSVGANYLVDAELLTVGARYGFAGF